MTHHDAGKYAAKHPGKSLDEDIAGQIREKAKDNKLSCADAHKIAADLNKTPEEVGTAMDLMEIRLYKCQLGLFGYGDKKKLSQIENIDPGIRKTIENNTSDSRISCEAAWDIADKFNISKIEIASVCDTMNLKIKPCQLGAFK